MMPEQFGPDESVTRPWFGIFPPSTQHITSNDPISRNINAIESWLYSDVEPIKGWESHCDNNRKQIVTDESIKPPQALGWPDILENTNTLFRCTARMPERFAGKRVSLMLESYENGLLLVNGEPYYGITPLGNTLLITPSAVSGEEYQFELRICSDSAIMPESCFAVADPEMMEIYWDFLCAYTAMSSTTMSPEVRDYLRNALLLSFEQYDRNETKYEAFRQQALRAHTVLREAVYDPAQASRHRIGLIHAVGHADIDIRETCDEEARMRQMGRICSSVLHLMEQHPDFRFAQHQPFLYAEMKNAYPGLFEQVKERVREGRWEAMGAFYTEPDGTLLSGESFIRQILFSMHFYEQEFGVTPRTAWLPEEMGLMWTLPQILVRSGFRFAAMPKMAACEEAQATHAFWWEGPDGSRIFSIALPADTSGKILPERLLTHWRQYSDKFTLRESLYVYGSNSGPDTEMLESIKRFQDFPGMAPIRHSTASECFERLFERTPNAHLPVINDECGVERSRGAYSANTLFKKLHRCSEIVFRKAEMFSCFAGGAYPSEVLHQGWKTLFTNQYLAPPREDSSESYYAPIQIGEKTLREAYSSILERIDTRGGGYTSAVVFNSQHFERNGLVYLDYTDERRENLHVALANGETVLYQIIEHFETGKRMLVLQPKGVPPFGYKLYHILRISKGAANAPEYASPLRVTPTTLDNEHIRATFNSRGELISLFDKETQRECIDPVKRGNVFRLFEDKSSYSFLSMDVDNKSQPAATEPAWGWNELDMTGDVQMEVIEEGPLRAAIQVTRTVSQSKIIQRITLAREGKRLDFETCIEWRKMCTLLQVQFNTTIRARMATYDIPFGVIERSAARGSAYGDAPCETPAHFWMDMSQPDYGLSLLNDGRYDHEAHGQMMALTLLNSSIFSKRSDIEDRFWFTYSLYPHAGSWREGRTHEQALDLNDPVDAVFVDSHPGELPPEHSFVQIQARTSALEAFKQAEEGAWLILRIAERQGAQDNVRVAFAQHLDTVHECNLLEREDTPIVHDGQQFEFTIRPFEIRTFKVRMA